MPRSLNVAWWNQLTDIMSGGREVSPRGQLTAELPSRTLVFDMNYPVVTHPDRKLGYKFMAAEAWWILSGRDDVASIAPYSKAISKFSDDGHKFFGAYGPPIVEQLPYVVGALMNDEDSRQALLTTWRPSPPATKDVPCTVAMDFLIRDGCLELHVFMRSSDNWLGVPYDAFNFTMIACEVARQLNFTRTKLLRLGTCYLTAASSHVYARNFSDVAKVLESSPADPVGHVPPALYSAGKHGYVVNVLEALKDTEVGDYRRWWEA